jgi:hypothetical protein
MTSPECSAAALSDVKRGALQQDLVGNQKRSVEKTSPFERTGRQASLRKRDCTAI